MKIHFKLVIVPALLMFHLVSAMADGSVQIGGATLNVNKNRISANLSSTLPVPLCLLTLERNSNNETLSLSKQQIEFFSAYVKEQTPSGVNLVKRLFAANEKLNFSVQHGLPTDDELSNVLKQNEELIKHQIAQCQTIKNQLTGSQWNALLELSQGQSLNVNLGK